MSRVTWVLFVGLLWIHPVLGARKKLRECLKKSVAHVVVADYFSAFLDAKEHWNHSTSCIIFVDKNQSKPQTFGKEFPEIRENNGFVLYFPRSYLKRELQLYFMEGTTCNGSNFTDFSYLDSMSCINYTAPVPCQITCLNPMTECEQSPYEKYCDPTDPVNKYRMTIRTRNCQNCDNPVKQPESNLWINPSFSTEAGEMLNAAEAVGVVNEMAKFAASVNGSAALNAGEGVTGILVKQNDPAELVEMLFGYTSPNDTMSILEERNVLGQFSRSVRLPQAAFEQAKGLNVTEPFGAILRFLNLDMDELKSTILGNEVLAIEIGAPITNLTDKISIDFRNMQYKGIPTCHSWNGDGKRPNWTQDGCLTIQNGDDITCECSHLTFFAILLVPLNESISSSDLNNLTTITRVGCGVSMFFLSIVLFMHFLFRKANASVSTMILIHLVSALFLLNFTFLINDVVASLGSPVGCKMMAALMHYFMLATFTWFAAQAFHLCVLLYVRGPVGSRHYLLKVSVVSWVQPSAIVILMLILGKYGERAVSASDSGDHVAFCWITDNNWHYIVNIGYYVLVFIFTFTIFIIILSYLFCLKRTTKQGDDAKTSTDKKSITVILGLCCTMGITWGFAFFAYGPLRIPSYYIFTILNSFQGFFLFIYYHYNSDPRKVTEAQKTPSSHSTLQTTMYNSENPYGNLTWQNPAGQTGA